MARSRGVYRLGAECGYVHATVEIDGEGHDGSLDPERTAALRIPVQRWRPDQLVASDFEL